MPNPKIPNGTLNKVRASIKFVDHPELNVSASYLGKQGIIISPQGNMTESLPVMTGVVQSPQPYQIVTAKFQLVRSMPLAAQFKKQWESNTIIGDAMFYSDSTQFGDFEVFNAAITSVMDISSGSDQPGVDITITGTYYINSEMWDL